MFRHPASVLPRDSLSPTRFCTRFSTQVNKALTPPEQISTFAPKFGFLVTFLMGIILSGRNKSHDPLWYSQRRGTTRMREPFTYLLVFSCRLLWWPCCSQRCGQWLWCGQQCLARSARCRSPEPRCWLWSDRWFSSVLWCWQWWFWYGCWCLQQA